MRETGPVSKLLLRWEELDEKGQDVSAAELCRDCPELAQELDRQIEAWKRMRWLQKESAEKDLLRAVSSPAILPRQRFHAGDSPIPGYRLLSLLGQGGFGEVWKCQSPDGQFRAIKLVSDGPTVPERDRRVS